MDRPKCFHGISPHFFLDMTTTTKSDLFALHVITEPDHLAKLILKCFEDIRDFGPGVLDISCDFPDRNSRELTITWKVNGCDWNEDSYSTFFVTNDVILYVLDAALCRQALHPFWHLIYMYLLRDRVSTRFDRLYAYAHAAYVCERESEMFLDPEHPFLDPSSGRCGLTDG